MSFIFFWILYLHTMKRGEEIAQEYLQRLDQHIHDLEIGRARLF